MKWGGLAQNPGFIDVQANRNYEFRAGYKIYESLEATEPLTQKNGQETFTVKWKDAMSLAARTAAAITVIAALV